MCLSEGDMNSCDMAHVTRLVPPKLSVGDRLDPNLLLHANDILDSCVLDDTQVLPATFLVVKFLSLFEEGKGTFQGTTMFCAERGMQM